MALIARFLDWLIDRIAPICIPDDVFADLDFEDTQISRPVLPGAGKPADAAVSPQAFSVGGHLKSDEQVIEELVADYREFLRMCFRK